jgi:hypothetical protein
MSFGFSRKTLLHGVRQAGRLGGWVGGWLVGWLVVSSGTKFKSNFLKKLSDSVCKHISPVVSRLQLPDSLTYFE